MRRGVCQDAPHQVAAVCADVAHQGGDGGFQRGLGCIALARHLGHQVDVFGVQAKVETGVVDIAHGHGREHLEREGQIAHVSYGRVFRNEDLDATHEHTFYQCEGVFVSKDANLGQMLGTLHAFFEEYYGEKLKIRTQPGYFPFTEPSLEFLIEKPASIGGKPGEWLEMLGCGMIHPNVLRSAGIDPTEYRGFAWGGGIERLVMLKYGIDDIRYFESGRLDFLRSF